MASSLALQQFQKSLAGARILVGLVGVSQASFDQEVCDQTCMMAAIASAVGAWEGYLEAVLVEFVAKTRVHAHARAWPLIAQFEVMVQKAVSDLNTPNWEKAREILIRVTGVDPYASWLWSDKHSSQNDTKEFFDGFMSVRHAFAHGFSVPSNIRALQNSSALDSGYVDDVLLCLTFFASTTDGLLEHELKHKHDCRSGW